MSQESHHGPGFHLAPPLPLQTLSLGTTSPGCGHPMLSPRVSVSLEGAESVKQSGVAWLESQACLWRGGQDLVSGSPAITQWNGGGVDPQRKGCCDQN